MSVARPLPIHVPHREVADFCRRHHVRKLSFFGSVVRPDFGPASDVDVLVEFQEGHTPGLGFFAMERELGQILGRRVDLNTPGFLSPGIALQAQSEAVAAYDAS